jgi:hypothetical protein
MKTDWDPMTYTYISCTNTFATQSWPDDDPIDGSKHVALCSSVKYIHLFSRLRRTLFTNSFIYNTGRLNSKLYTRSQILPMREHSAFL